MIGPLRLSYGVLPLVLAASVPALASAQSGPIEEPLAQWRADHGDHWRVDVDEGTGYAEFLFGGSVEAEFEPQDEADWFTLARVALERTAALHGIEQATLVEHWTQYLPLPWTTDKMTVRFRQMVGGVPVEEGFVNVLFDQHGTLLSVQARALPNVASFDVKPAIGGDVAAGLAARVFQLEEGVPGSVAAEPRLAVLQLDQDESRVPRLVWQVDVQWLLADAEPIGHLYSIDARSGAVVHREESVHHFDVGGTVSTMATPGTAPDSGTNPETSQSMKYARVTSPAGTVFTDANGVFNFPGQAGPLNCTFTYVGTYNNVQNSAGAAYSLVVGLTGTGNSVLLNPGSVDTVTAQANVFVAVNRVRDWVRSVNPLDSKADFVHTANVNQAQTCNAFFNGNSINFFAAGGGCVNTAYSTVVAHEDGHWLNVIYGTGNGGDGMGEGNADVWAMYIYDDPIVGLNFCGSGCHVRNGNNNTAFCGDCCSACYGEVHADGEPLMGAMWKVRNNLNIALGNATGDATANSLFLGWMNSYNQTQIKSVIETQWLTLDDNDGNINNGTPNFTSIDNGFRAQGFPGVTLVPIAISNVTQIADTTNQNGPYPASATVNSNVGATITSATIFYRAGTSGPFTQTAMSPSGNVWTGAIPGQIAPKKVYYYVRVNDSLANVATFPANAPTSTLNFSVGALSTVFCDNFDAVQAWTVTNTAVTTGAWERGDPIGTNLNGTPAQPETDNPAGTGTQCMFTDQGVVGGAVGDADLDGGPTTLTSPVFDLSVGNGEISYAYWMFNDDGDDSLVVQLSNNNGSTWTTARTYLGGAGNWVTDDVDVGSFVTPTATVRIRFQVSDNPNDSITEAAIDDVCVQTLGPVGCNGGVTAYCTAKINSQFCTPAIASNGVPSASSAAPFDISASLILNQKSGLLFYGYGTNNAPFQGGIMCIQTPVRRTPPQGSGGSAVGNDCTGTMTYDFNARIQSGIDPQLQAGQFCAAQYYYRDPSDPFTTGLTNAVSFTICP
jgi:hypothetical protein